eukprot:1439975-Amphidinium_carterae.1
MHLLNMDIEEYVLIVAGEMSIMFIVFIVMGLTRGGKALIFEKVSETREMLNVFNMFIVLSTENALNTGSVQSVPYVHCFGQIRVKVH